MGEGVKRLLAFLDYVKDEKLRNMVRDLLLDLRVSLTDTKVDLERSPGGRSKHHAYEGGLIQHTEAVTRLALFLCDLVEEVYGGQVDRDVVVVAALLHDLMKAPTYEEREDGTYSWSSLGERLDHLSLIIAELYSRGFPLDVIHAVAAHHAEHGPIMPKTLEALIVHVADMADARLNGGVLHAARRLVAEATGVEPTRLSCREAFEIVRVKAKKGWDGVRSYAQERLGIAPQASGGE